MAKYADGSEDIVNVHIKIPKPMLEDIDRRARANLMSRRDYIRQALMTKMGRQNMIDPPDPNWEPVSDQEAKLRDILKGL